MERMKPDKDASVIVKVADELLNDPDVPRGTLNALIGQEVVEKLRALPGGNPRNDS
jgi:hypothetical protein